jgi:hypothetical protein
MDSFSSLISLLFAFNTLAQVPMRYCDIEPNEPLELIIQVLADSNNNIQYNYFIGFKNEKKDFHFHEKRYDTRIKINTTTEKTSSDNNIEDYRTCLRFNVIYNDSIQVFEPYPNLKMHYQKLINEGFTPKDIDSIQMFGHLTTFSIKNPDSYYQKLLSEGVSSEQIYFYVSFNFFPEHIQIPKSQIKSLYIILGQEFTRENYDLDISEIEMLRNLDFDYIENIYIDFQHEPNRIYQTSECLEASLNFNKWPGYHLISKRENLNSIYLGAKFKDADIIEQINLFSNLKHLYIDYGFTEINKYSWQHVNTLVLPHFMIIDFNKFPKLQSFICHSNSFSNFEYYANDVLFERGFFESSYAEFVSNGEFRLFYPNGVLAIFGNMVDGKCDGVWKFYTPDGKIDVLNVFDKGNLNGLQIKYYHLENEVHEHRYYLSQNAACVGGVSCVYLSNIINNSFEHVFGKSFLSNDAYYSFDQNSGIDLVEKNEIVKTYKKGTPEYDKILRENFLNLLYPDYQVGKTPYDLMNKD